jgi:hypothetical protein
MKAVARGGRVIAAPGLSRDSLTRICGDQVKTLAAVAPGHHGRPGRAARDAEASPSSRLP